MTSSRPRYLVGVDVGGTFGNALVNRALLSQLWYGVWSAVSINEASMPWSRPRHAHSSTDCIRRLEFDAGVRQNYRQGKLRDMGPARMKRHLIAEYMKVYKGPQSDNPRVMKQLPNHDLGVWPRSPR